MAVQTFRINYKSDFTLKLQSDAGWAVPFCIKFWTVAPSLGYFVGYDGETWTRCQLDPDDPLKLIVLFDDHHLGVGDLQMQIAYHVTIEQFDNARFDEVMNPQNVVVDIDGTDEQVVLDVTGETAPEIEYSLPAYEAERQRQLAEQQREQDFSQMQSDFQTMEHDAGEATQAANDAATNANTKAGYAQDKGDYAKEQGDYAKTQGDYAKDEIDGAKGDYESLDARFDHVDEISMYFEDEETPSDQQLVDEYDRVLRLAYQTITDLLATKSRTEEATQAALQAAQHTLDAIAATQTAIQNANAARQQALDAATTANTAAQNAQDKANSANLAAVYAQQKATAAQTAASQAGSKAAIAQAAANDANSAATLANQKAGVAQDAADLATQKAGDAAEATTACYNMMEAAKGDYDSLPARLAAIEALLQQAVYFNDNDNDNDNN